MFTDGTIVWLIAVVPASNCSARPSRAQAGALRGNDWASNLIGWQRDGPPAKVGYAHCCAKQAGTGAYVMCLLL